MRTIRVRIASEATATESSRMSLIAAKTAAPQENRL